MAQLQEAREALSQVKTELLARKNVVATGVGRKVVGGETTEELALIVSVVQKEPESRLSAADRVPTRVAGMSTDVRLTGPVFAQQDPTDRIRPAPGGVSIGHVSITAGTLGCLVRQDGAPRILSNNHVLANSNDAVAGDAIIQPGNADGGSDPADRIARLGDFVPIVFDEGGGSDCPTGNAVADVLNAVASAVGSRTRMQVVAQPEPGENLVDCALAVPLDAADVLEEILGIGPPTGVAEGTLGLAVQKSGRTTGLTTGTIEQIDVTVQVSYGAGRTATFVDQLMAGAMSQGGDSGSAVLDMDNRLVGLLFAGSTNSTIINRIQNVFQLLDVTLS